MLKHLFFYSCLLLAPFFAQAQGKHLHSPSEMMEIADKSKVSYNVTEATHDYDHRPDTGNVLQAKYRRTASGSGFHIEAYDINIPAVRASRKAENAMRDQRFDSATYYYLDTYAKDSTYTIALTYAAQACARAGKYEDAVLLFKRSISKNYIDFLAHWYLADAYVAMGKNTLAQESIIVAHLFNRNHSGIQADLKRILALNQHQYDDSWYFNPQTEITKVDATHVDVKATEAWIGYAIGQALWTYEPGYKESMSNNEDLRFNMDMQQELLTAELVYMGSSKKKQRDAYPQDLKALKVAQDKGLFDAYIYYEVFLPQFPQLAAHFPEDIMDSMREYILHVRCPQ